MWKPKPFSSDAGAVAFVGGSIIMIFIFIFVVWAIWSETGRAFLNSWQALIAGFAGLSGGLFAFGAMMVQLEHYRERTSRIDESQRVKALLNQRKDVQEVHDAAFIARFKLNRLPVKYLHEIIRGNLAIELPQTLAEFGDAHLYLSMEDRENISKIRDWTNGNLTERKISALFVSYSKPRENQPVFDVLEPTLAAIVDTTGVLIASIDDQLPRDLRLRRNK